MVQARGYVASIERIIRGPDDPENGTRCWSTRESGGPARGFESYSLGDGRRPVTSVYIGNLRACAWYSVLGREPKLDATHYARSRRKKAVNDDHSRTTALSRWVSSRCVADSNSAHAVSESKRLGYTLTERPAMKAIRRNRRKPSYCESSGKTITMSCQI